MAIAKITTPSEADLSGVLGDTIYMIRTIARTATNEVYGYYICSGDIISKDIAPNKWDVVISMGSLIEYYMIGDHKECNEQMSIYVTKDVGKARSMFTLLVNELEQRVPKVYSKVVDE